MKRLYTFFSWCALWLVLPLCLNVAAQTTAFTYQGRLNESSLPATGLYDFQFKLFDALTGGVQIGSLQLSGPNSVTVTNGVFNVTLDFGAAAFPGAARFLEISVRVAGGGAFTTLTPRRELNSVPYAVRGLNSTTADSLSAACVTCVTDAQIAALAGSKVTGTIPVAGVPTGSGNYIQNTTSPQASSNFNISGNGTAGGTLSGNIVNATTQFNLNGNRVLANNGLENLFAGFGAGAVNTGEANAFFGFFAGISNTTGSTNAFFGNRAGSNNTTASNNSFFGFSAGLNNTTATNNAFFGSEAGTTNTTGSENTFIGRAAGIVNTTGSQNSFFGAFAGEQNTSGSFNSIFGVDAGKSITTATGNSFFGYVAGSSTTNSNNSFFGTFAGNLNTTGTANSFFGTSVGLNNTTGSLNSFFGVEAGDSTTIGDSNSFFGYQAGNANTTGVNNTIIGSSADVLQNNLANATAIGYRSAVICSNCLVLGSVSGQNGAVTSVNVGIATTNPVDRLHVSGDIRTDTGCVKNGSGTQIAGSCSSDLRFKRNITPFSNALPKLVQLQPVHFYWRATEFPAKHFGDTESYGLIAQEVEQVLPELVTEDEQGYKKVNYSKLPMLTLQAIKELKEENDALKKANAAMEARLSALEKLLQPAAPGKK